MSVAVIVWLPAVFSVALKVPTPLVSVLLRRQTRRAVAAGEVHRAAVAGGGVVELVLRRHREVEAPSPPWRCRGQLTAKCVAAAALTVMALAAGDAAVAVSVAVIVWLPAVFSVALNVPTPLVSVLLAGSVPGHRCW